MNCSKCGTPIPENALYCAACGEPITQSNEVALPPVIAAIHELFSAKNFFVATILMTVAAGAGLVGGGMPVFPILLAIAMWMAYSANKKGNVMGYATPLKFFSGIATAEVVVNWVLVGIMGVCGLILALAGSLLGSAFNEYSHYIGDFSDLYEMGIMDELGGVVIVVMGVLFILIAAGVAVFNALVVKNMQKCAKSVLLTFQTGVNQIVKFTFTRKWLIVIAVIQGISALSSLGADILAFASEGAAVAAYILIYLLLGDMEKKVEMPAL